MPLRGGSGAPLPLRSAHDILKFQHIGHIYDKNSRFIGSSPLALETIMEVKVCHRTASPIVRK